MFINHTSKQVTAKIVYYGTGLSGKTTNLQYIYSITNPKSRGELISMETDIERTLFFDLLPINVGAINGYETKFQLYTVPGQIFYDSTRKIVLKGVDGIVFVADSQELMSQGNIDSFQNLKNNLKEQNVDINKIPLVIQYNKRDLKNILSVDKLNSILNELNAPSHEAIAINGDGVLETLKDISSLTLIKIKEEIDSNVTPKPQESKVNFDTDKNKTVKNIEDIPLKTLSPENLDEFELEFDMETDSRTYKIPKIEEEPIEEIKTQGIAKKINYPENLNKENKDNLKKAPKKEESKPINKTNNIDEKENKTGVEKTGKKTKKNKPFPKNSLDILNSLNDNTRKTIIKKIKFNDNINTLNILDSKSNIIETFQLELDENTKKITIILDVKR